VVVFTVCFPHRSTAAVQTTMLTAVATGSWTISTIICSVFQAATDVAASGIRGICTGVPVSYTPLFVLFLPTPLSGLGNPTCSNATAGLAVRVTGHCSSSITAKWKYHWRGIHNSHLNKLINFISVFLWLHVVTSRLDKLIGGQVLNEFLLWNANARWCAHITNILVIFQQNSRLHWPVAVTASKWAVLQVVTV
jgi:hypothetical protein